jgi:DNA polymerase
VLKPVYDIRNCGPRHRFCANGKLVHNSNFQNLTRSDPDFANETLNIREAIVAPEGYFLAPVDSSQIECRLLNYVAGQNDVIENFRTGKDPYTNVAGQFYGYEVNKKDHPTERQVGKVLELQAGYGSGGEKIRATLRTKAGIMLTPAQGVLARDAYRDTHPEVVALWKEGGRMISALAGGPDREWGPTIIKNQRIYLPNGCPLIYDTIEYYHDHERGEKYWRVRKRYGWTKLYGAKLVENLIQALARVVMSQAMIRLKRFGYRSVTTTHDELCVLIPKDGREKEHLEVCKAEFRRTPDWLPGIPLDCEGSLSDRYSK